MCLEAIMCVNPSCAFTQEDIPNTGQGTRLKIQLLRNMLWIKVLDLLVKHTT